MNDFQRLLMGGVNLNAADQNGDTALMVAAKKGEILLVIGCTNSDSCLVPIKIETLFMLQVQRKW